MKHNDGKRSNELARMIVTRIAREKELLSAQFNDSVKDVGVRHCVIDDVLPASIAQAIYDAFPPTPGMRFVDTFREKKYTTRSLEKYESILSDITFAFQHPRVVRLVEEITGIKGQLPDASLYAGGLSVMKEGHFLGPHVDNSHDATRAYYRTLNLLYYVSPDWKMDFGGNLELWEPTVRRHITVVSKFNRLAIMETNPSSWHSVSNITVARRRCCVSNYYFSQRSPIGKEYFNITAFSARPEQKIRRVIAWGDRKLRQIVRRFAPGGLGEVDTYNASAK